MGQKLIFVKPLFGTIRSLDFITSHFMLFQVALNIITEETLIILLYCLPPSTLDITSTSSKGKELSVAYPEEKLQLMPNVSTTHIASSGKKELA